MPIPKGTIEIQGSPHDLVRSGVDFAKLVGTIETPDVKVHRDTFKRQLSTISQTLSVESLNSLSECPDDTENEKNCEGVPVEASSKGQVKGSLFVNYFTSGANWCVVLFLFGFFIFLQIIASATDYFVSIW